MPWPIESDYFEAIQNPRNCFDDPELKQGNPTLTALGLPKPITGAFASVYQLNCPTRRWAVRCFLRDFADHQRRYNAISDHLRRANLPYTVGFEFLQRGIRIRGTWYPALKMEWIDGETLNAYVARNVNQPQVLNQLARQWVEMMSALRASQIAHGDLQHGNVLVSQSRLRLIDYDGMFVPALGGMTSHEEGHRNYQHPFRTSRDFNIDLDNFSAWVIFLSISATAIEPRLWQLLNGGDESLLFRRGDFDRPDTSKALQAFSRSTRSELQALAAHFRGLLRLSLRQVPALDGTPVPSTTRPAPAPPPATGVPDWLRGQVPEEAPSPAAPASLLEAEVRPAQHGGASASWIISHLVDQKPVVPVFPTSQFLWLRFFAVLILLLSAGWIAWAAIILNIRPVIMYPAAAAPALLYLASIWVHYRSLDIVGQKVRLSAQKTESKQKVKRIEAAIASLASERRQIAQPLIEIDAAYRSVPQSLQVELQRHFRRLEQALAKLKSDRDSLTKREIEEIGHLERRTARDVNHLHQQRNAIDQAEQTELGRLGSVLREQHLAHSLRAAYLSNASIHGVGPKLTARLNAYGIHTAADIDSRVYHVPGFGPTKCSELFAWRSYVESRAATTAPTPNPSDILAVKNKYGFQRHPILNQLAGAQAGEQRERQEVMDNFARYRQQVDQEEIDIKRRHDHDADFARREHEHRRAELVEKFNRLKGEVKVKQRELDRKLTELQQSLFGKEFDLLKLRRELERYRYVSFYYYTTCALGLRRRTA